MNDLYFTEVIDYFTISIAFLGTPLGIVLAICILAGVITAVFSYPKHVVRNFFIYAVCIFFTTSFFWYIDTNNGSFELVRLIYRLKEYLSYWSFGLGYAVVLGSVFWGTVGITAIAGRNKEISLAKRMILIVGISFVAILFAKACNDMAFVLAIITGQKWYDIMMT